MWPSIGGWTLSDNFPGITATSAGQATFAQECVRLIEAYGFDGVDERRPDLTGVKFPSTLFLSLTRDVREYVLEQ